MPSFNRTHVGRRAEALAANFLEREGFSILERNARVGPLEVDLVARQGDLLVIAEVRSRAPGFLEGPLASVSHRKRVFLLKAARGLWRKRFRFLADIRRVRIDIIGVRTTSQGVEIEWVKGAITEDTA